MAGRIKKEAEEESKVILMGEEIAEGGSRHYHGGGVWGVFLIFSGSLLLLNSFGTLPWEIWNRLIDFWPVLLILVGIRIMLGKSLLSRLLMTLISLFVFGTIFLFVLSKEAPLLVESLPRQWLQWANVWEVIRR